MIEFRPLLWTSASAALLLAACGGEGGGKSAAGEGGEAAAASSAPAEAAGEGGEGAGGEGGEAGAAGAYAATPAASKPALHVAQLKGFFLIAQRQTEGADAAAALAGQGLLEAYDTEKAVFQRLGANEAVLRKAAQTGAPAELKAAIAELDRLQAKAGGDPAAVARGLVSIASGLYGNVEHEGVVDAIEYQHALGAALSAQDLLAKAADPRAKAAKPQVDRLIALFPAPQAPEKITPKAQVLAQASRAELELG
ncbi:MAG TPA: hypothetical protein VF559_07120 [Caulobacteraceae bacterium]|jgi:hypothetical protein